MGEEMKQVHVGAEDDDSTFEEKLFCFKEIFQHFSKYGPNCKQLTRI